jgi:AcrR family transcriptional regulator
VSDFARVTPSSARPAVRGRYRGRSADERRALRRGQLIAAGVELVGTRGYAATTVRDVCRAAGLTERYFYESFPDREALLLEVYDEVIGRVASEVLKALDVNERDAVRRIRAGVAAFVGTLAGDARLARIQLFEVVGVSEAVEARRRAAMALFAGVLRTVAADLDPTLLHLPEALRTTAETMLVGACHEAVVDWSLTGAAVPVDDLVDRMTHVLVATLRGLRPGS